MCSCGKWLCTARISARTALRLRNNETFHEAAQPCEPVLYIEGELSFLDLGTAATAVCPTQINCPIVTLSKPVSSPVCTQTHLKLKDTLPPTEKKTHTHRQTHENTLLISSSLSRHDNPLFLAMLKPLESINQHHPAGPLRGLPPPKS